MSDSLLSKLQNRASQTQSQSRESNLGIILDSDSSYLDSLTKTSFAQHSKGKTSTESARWPKNKLVRAFISSYFDYCDALYTGLAKAAVIGLQRIQNAAAVGWKKRREIT